MSTEITETVFLTRDNTVDLQLSSDSIGVDFSGVNRIDLLDRDCSWEVSSENSPDAITWTVSGEYLIVMLALGDEPIPVGDYTCRVIVYDPSNPNGIVWGEIKLIIEAACAVGT